MMVNNTFSLLDWPLLTEFSSLCWTRLCSPGCCCPSKTNCSTCRLNVLANIQCRNIYTWHKMGVHIEKEPLLRNRWIPEKGSAWPPFQNWPAITRAGNCHAVVCSTDNFTPTEKTIGTPVHTDTFRRTIIINIINHPPCSEWAASGQNFQTWGVNVKQFFFLLWSGFYFRLFVSFISITNFCLRGKKAVN